MQTTVRFYGQLLPISDLLDMLMESMSAKQACSEVSRRLANRFIPIPEAN